MKIIIELLFYGFCAMIVAAVVTHSFYPSHGCFLVAMVGFCGMMFSVMGALYVDESQANSAEQGDL